MFDSVNTMADIFIERHSDVRVASTNGVTALLNDGVPGGESVHALPHGRRGTSASGQIR